jgi:hypothetical protein
MDLASKLGYPKLKSNNTIKAALKNHFKNHTINFTLVWQCIADAITRTGEIPNEYSIKLKLENKLSAYFPAPEK